MRLKAMRRWMCGVVLGVCAAAPLQGFAWGRMGHRLTALVAENYLTPETKAAIRELLGTDDIAGIASWADEYRRDHPETGPWHYADTPDSEASYSRDRDCPLPKTDAAAKWRDCVVDRVAYFEMRLGDKTLPKAERAEALKFLVHFMGDIHQPFHVLGDSRGGNDVRVTFLGSQQCGNFKCNLHGVWDDQMIQHHDMNESKYVAYLLADIKEHDWEKRAGGTPVQWANVSHHYATQAMAPDGAMISKDYYNEEISIIDAQMALGGLRLARVLNVVLSGVATP